MIMMKTHKISAPLDDAGLRPLKAGEKVLISGVIQTARDASLKRLEALKRSPLDLRGGVIYFAGPSPAPPGKVIGSIGPTTTARMEKYFPWLLERGVRGLIGKGALSPEGRSILAGAGAVYFAAVGGAGALLAQAVREAEAVLYPELGPEAVYRLGVEGFPAYLILDARGRSL